VNSSTEGPELAQIVTVRDIGEESAKAFKCLSVLVLGFPQVSRRDIEQGHRGKLMMARVMADLLFPLWKDERELPPSIAEATARMEELVSQDNKAKQLGLYADIGSNGSLRKPSAAICQSPGHGICTLPESDRHRPLAHMGSGTDMARDPPAVTYGR
jgi:AbiV family abortive infection protein